MKINIPRNPVPKMHDCITVSFFYPMPFAAIDEGRMIFGILNEFNLMPDKYQMTKHRKQVPFDYQGIESFLANNWDFATHWAEFNNKVHTSTYLDHFEVFRTKKPRYRGNLDRCGGGGRVNHSQISLNVKPAGLKKNDFNGIKDFISECMKLSTPDFARIQFYTGDEELQSCKGKEPDTILVGRQLSEEHLPDLYNVSIWGKPYIDFFGKKKLLSTPCHKVEELQNGLIWMQLSEHVFDEKGCWTELSEVREKAKAHLNNNAFRDRSLPFDHKYDIPEFDLSEIEKAVEKANEIDRHT